MTTPEAEPHVRAVMTMLEGQLPESIGVALGVGPAGAPPYIAVYPDIGTAEQGFLSGDRSRLTIRYFLHAVGTGPEQALWALDKARLVMLGDPPVIPGRQVGRMKQEYSSPTIDRDETVQPALYIAMAGFCMVSQPAS